ncbi:MAG: cutinase family protein [Mycobacterium sp.]
MTALRLMKAAGATLVAAAAVVTPSIAFAPVASADCPDIEVVFARGTDDSPGLGAVGGAFVNALSGKVGGRSVGSYAVNYPADYDFLAAADGANDASAHVQYMMGACPNTRLVLGGYSQGAAVMDVIAAVPIPAIGFTNPLPPNAPDFVAAIAVFGNPSAKLGLPLTMSPVWGGRAIDLCNGGDPICQTDGQDVAAHRSPSYTGGFVNTAADFVAGRV